MAKKQKKTPVQKRTGAVTLLSLFCAAAGVYAESDGWSYNDVEKSVIHAGESHARIAPVKKGEELEDQSKIGNIKKAEISDNASFRYDPALGKDELKGVVFDNESGVQESASLKMSEGASLDVDATKSRDGKTDWSGKSAVGVEFAKDTTATIEAKDASISVKGDTGATAISASDPSTKLGNVEIGSVSAKATDSAKAFAINANDADSVKIGSVSGNIKVADAGTVDLGSMQGNIEAANVKDSISVAEKITGNITATSAKNVGIGEISGDVKIDTIGNSVNIDSLDGNLASTNVGDSSSESSVANITVKSASNTAREVNIDNLAATATISGDEENAEAAKVNVGTAEKKLSVNGKVEARVDEAKGGLSAELKNADANALYVKSVKGGAEIAGEGNVNIVNAEASEAPAIKIGDLKGNFAAGVDASAATSGAIKGNVEIGSISGNTGIINLDGNLTAGTLGADETSATLIGVSGADKTVDITTANGTTTVNGNGSLEAKVGTSNGTLTVNDYKKATIGEVKDGSKLVLNGSDKDAIADVTKADKVEANALGKTTIDSANYVKASDSIDASLSIKGQNVKITDASGEYVVDTKALANEGTVEINKGSIANSIDGFNGNVKANETGTIKVEGAGMTGGLDIGKINGDLTSAENAKISGNVNVGEVNKVDVKGGIAAIDGKENTGNLTIGTANDNVAVSGGVAGNMKVADAKKDVAVDTVGKNLTIDMLNGGTVKADEVTETVKVSAGTGSIEVAKAGNVDAATTDGKLTIDGQKVSTNGSLSIKGTEVAEGGQIHVGAIDIDSTVKGFKGDLTVDSNTGKIDVSTIDGILTVNDAQKDVNVSESAKAVIANITVNSGTANVGSAKSLDATVNGGSLNVDSVASSSNATVKANGGKSIFKTIAGKLKALLNGGEVEVVKNTGNVEISGSGDATVKDSTGSLEVATSTADKFVKNANGGISTKGNLNVAINKATSANFGTVNGGDIVDMTKIDNLTVSESTGILNVGLEGGQVKGNIVIEKATADVNVGNVANLDVTLRNNANLLAIDNTKVDAARVNGGCDASYYNVGTLKVDRSLDGNLEVRGAVSNSADINNVSGTVAINEVASTATASVKNAGSAIVDKANGNVEFFDFASGSATVNNATAKIEATNIAGGLNIGNVKDVKVNNTNVNVLDGNTVNGKIESTSDMTLSNSGTATIGNSGQIVVNGDLNVASEFKFAESTRNGAVIKANNLSGSGATKTVDNFFDAKFGFSGDDSVMEAAALKGTHNAGSSYIDANIDDMSVSHTYVDVTYKNTDGSSKVGYEITKNSYLSDKFAKSDNEKALAEIYDNLVFQDDATKDGESVQKKKNFKALAENGNIGAMLPQAVNHAARMNMDLSNMIHLDTINRTAYTRDMLNRINYLKAKGKLRGRHSDVLSGASSVTVRNINRFASYSGDGNIAGSNDSVYGGLANAEYVFDDSLFAGIGIGGFQAKSNGKDASGKAETQSFALNAYADYLFYDNFDWYFGLTYAYGMNEAERNSGSSMNKGKWNSNLVGAFTGVRYAWKPIADREFYIKPLLGMNVSFLMNPSFTENGDSERLDVDSEDYTSVKSIAGIEASYLLDCGLSVAGRMFYAHEFADNRYDITSSFIGSGYSVNTFKTLGSEIKRDTGIFSIGLGYDINTDWRVYLDYAAEVADDVYHNLNAGVQFKF